MKQKLLSILALLLMTATGAMAQTETLLTTITATGTGSYSETTPGVVTVTHDNDDFDGDWGWLWYFHAGAITVEAKDGYTITRCVFRQADKSPVTISSAPFKVKFVETHPYGDDYVKYLCEGTDPDEDMDGVSSIEVYGPAAPVNVTANEGATGEYWATYYNATQGYTADVNTKVFQAALTGSQLTMTEVANREIPAGKAVILKSSYSSITLTPATTSATLEGNALQGTATAITNPGNAYVLSKGAKGVGFYKLSSTGTIGVNKAYLTYSGATAREFFSIEGNVTGIEMPKAATTNSDAEVYDLQGRQVANPTKGLYIVNGKKVFINK